MAEASARIDGLIRLIREGETALRTEYVPAVGAPAFVDESGFGVWRARALTWFGENLPSDNEYVRTFKSKVSSHFAKSVRSGIEILKAIKGDVESGYLTLMCSDSRASARDDAALIFTRFYEVVDQLQRRHANRSPFLVEDEYDVQDLLHALLRLFFDDVRVEEWTPSYAGSAARMDFFLREVGTIIEVKKTRPSLSVKDLGEQLIVDIAKYRSRPDCKRLLCFVYDPEHKVPNPRGIENDLCSHESDFSVEVWIRP